VCSTSSPPAGALSPLSALEFGLLYAAFRRRLAKAKKQPLPWTLWALEALLFLTAMLVNGAGSFSSVIAVIHLDTPSFAAIADQFGQLHATCHSTTVFV